MLLSLDSCRGPDSAFFSAEDQRKFAGLPGVLRVDFLRAQSVLIDPAQPRVVLGDARISLEREPPQNFDVLIVEPDKATLEATLAFMDRSSSGLRASLGASVSVLGYTMDDARALIARGDNFMDGVAREAAAARPGTAPSGLPRAIVVHEGLTLSP